MAYDLLLRRQTPSNWACSTSIMGLSDEKDPMVLTPTAVKAEMDRVLLILDTVNYDVSQAFGEHKITDDEWQLWRRLYTAGHDFTSKASHQWGSNVEVARHYETDALKWRELVASRGGKLRGPADLGRHADDFPTTKVALAVGGVAAAAFLITSLRKKF